jgi:hypothetical protein
MKAHSIVVTTTWLLALGCTGQSTTGESTYVVDPVVSALKSNALYLGFDNPLAIAAADVPCSSLNVLSDNGAFVGDSCLYSIRPEKVGMATITVTRFTNNGQPVQSKSFFRVLEAPTPIAVIAGRSLNDGSISRESLVKGSGVILKLDDFLFDVAFKVTRFDLMVIRHDQTAQRFISHSAKFTEEMKAEFATLNSGDGILVHGIRASGPTGEVRIADLYLVVQ